MREVLLASPSNNLWEANDIMNDPIVPDWDKVAEHFWGPRVPQVNPPQLDWDEVNKRIWGRKDNQVPKPPKEE